MATAASRDIKEFVFEWEGKDRAGKVVRGEIRAVGENQVKNKEATHPLGEKDQA